MIRSTSALGVLLAMSGLASACGTPVFLCREQGDCNPGGTCEANGRCSFPDARCEGSGRRYGDLSGRLSKQCVEDQDLAEGEAESAAVETTLPGTTTSEGESTGVGESEEGEHASTLVPFPSDDDPPRPGPVTPYELLCQPPSDGRVLDGLVALYTLDEGTGTVARNSTCVDLNANLDFASASDSIVWNTELGGLDFRGSGSASSGNVTKLREVLIDANDELTLELWLQPWDPGLDTWGRVIALSDVSGEEESILFEVNQALSPEGAPYWEIILRTTSGDDPLDYTYVPIENGDLSQIVFVYQKGEETVFVNTRDEVKEWDGGDFKNWPREGTARLTLGDDPQEDRPWSGTATLVAIYDRALSWLELDTNYKVYWGVE